MKDDYLTKKQLMIVIEDLRHRLSELQTELDNRNQSDKPRNEEHVFLQKLIDAIPAPIFYKDRSGKYLGCNKSFEEYVGLSKNEIVGKTVYDLSPKELADKYNVMDEELYSHPGDQVYEYAVRHADGTIREVIFKKSTFSIEGSEIAGLVGVMIDITGRKKAEEALKDKEHFLDSIFMSIQDGISILDKDLNIIRVNNVMEQWYSHAQPLTGKKCYEAYHSRKEHCDACPTLKTLETGEASYEIVAKRGPKGEVTGWLDLYAFPLVDEPKGELKGVIEYVRDISDRKQAEEVLKEREERYRSLVETIPHGILENDTSGIITFGNAAYHNILGYEPGELIGQPVWHAARSEEEKEELRNYLTYLVNQQPLPTTFFAKNRTKDGRLIDVQVDWTYKRDSTGRLIGFTSVMTDITERNILQAQLLHAQKMEAVGQLAGGIAHDFNNILTAIIGYGNIMQMKMNDDDPLRVNLDQMIAGAERAVHLTGSLLAFSRKQIIEMKLDNLNRIIRGIEKILKRIIREDIELTTQLTSRDLTILADSGQLEQILMNLAANARDAMPDGGKLILETEQAEIDSEFQKKHGYGKPGKYALLSVSDTGEGIDPKIGEKIFEPFFTTKEVGKGTGLGLSITYGIVKQHNGYITFSSKSGTGTTFHIYVPLMQARIEEPLAKEDVIPQRGTETVLIAEDDETIRRLLNEILTAAGYTVIAAEDGANALNKFREHSDRIEFLVSDIIMPKMNGKDLYKEIKRLKPGVKALFISGYAGELIQDKGILDEGIHFMDKPISSNKLLQKMREILDH